MPPEACKHGRRPALVALVPLLLRRHAPVIAVVVAAKHRSDTLLLEGGQKRLVADLTLEGHVVIDARLAVLVHARLVLKRAHGAHGDMHEREARDRGSSSMLPPEIPRRPDKPLGDRRIHGARQLDHIPVFPLAVKRQSTTTIKEPQDGDGPVAAADPVQRHKVITDADLLTPARDHLLRHAEIVVPALAVQDPRGAEVEVVVVVAVRRRPGHVPLHHRRHEPVKVRCRVLQLRVVARDQVAVEHHQVRRLAV